MKRFISMLFLFLLWPSLALATPVLSLTWDLYQQGATPAQRLVLLRGVGSGTPTTYLIFYDLGITQYSDTAIKKGKVYCYQLQAVTQYGQTSALSNRACAQAHTNPAYWRTPFPGQPEEK